MTRSVAAGAAALPVLLAAAARAAGGEGGESPSLTITTLNLVILLAVLVYFGRKPVRAFFAERRHRIQGELKAAEDLRAEVEARYAEWQRKLAELDAELEQLRGRARERAEAERERILAEAGVAAERIRREAQSAIEQELRRSRIQLREEAADLAVELAGSLLRTQVTEADRERLLDEFIERVEQSGRAASRSGGDRDPTSGGNGGGRTA